MSTTSVGLGSAASAQLSVSHWLAVLRVPLGAWSVRRRLAVAGLIATCVFVIGLQASLATDFGGIEASRTTLAATTRQFEEARRSLAQLPALRERAAAFPARLKAASTSADDVRMVSELAAQSNVALLAVEPGALSGTGPQSMRALQLTAHTDFVHLMAFLHALGELPVLVVPVDVTLKREAHALAMSATLHVFHALRPVAASATAGGVSDDSLDADDEDDVVFFDPFLLPQTSASGNLAELSQLRLAGLLHDRARGLALIDTPDGPTTVAQGQQIGAERVTRLDGFGITLVDGAATRTLAFAEAL
ncbi:hypothetical protein [Paraburkholderia sp. BCC1886]|uniref:hypothetical protein n=1 Tax=Paraburkholderia sp. BCC1886 TaxID=2562670 RepID=UPI001181FBE6|nr:hypothetical protein [Paraburkholderia sp. BCC1886]